MKYCLILFASCLVIGCQQKKATNYFTGTIIYNYHYTSDSMNADSLSSSRPDVGIMMYADDGYQSIFSRSDSSIRPLETRNYYYGPLNTCVIQETDTLYCEDYGTANDSVLSLKIYDAKEKILGYTCKVLEMQKKTSLVKYHVSTDLKTHPLTYKNHRAYNWDVYGNAADGGIILKVEHVFKHFTLHGSAGKILLDNKQENSGLKEMMKLCQ